MSNQIAITIIMIIAIMIYGNLCAINQLLFNPQKMKVRQTFSCIITTKKKGSPAKSPKGVTLISMNFRLFFGEFENDFIFFVLKTEVPS